MKLITKTIIKTDRGYIRVFGFLTPDMTKKRRKGIMVKTMIRFLKLVMHEKLLQNIFLSFVSVPKWQSLHRSKYSTSGEFH